MVRIVISVLLLIVLAVLVSFNLGFTTSVNLFGTRFDNVPVMAVALLSFAAGVVFSFILYIGRFLHTRKKESLAKRHKDVSERERKMSERESEAHRAAETSAEKAAADQTAAVPGTEKPRPTGTWRSRFARFFNPDR